MSNFSNSPVARSTASIDSSTRYARLGSLSWLHFLNDGSANYLPGILPAVLITLHASVSLAATVMSALLIGQALQVPSGWLADRIGGRTFIIVGVLGSSLAAAFIGFASSLWALLPILLIIGLSNALFHPQAMAGARSLSGNRHGLGMSIFLVGGEIGRGLWPILASLLVVYWGIHYLWLLAIPAALSTPLLWHYLPQQPRRHPDAQPIAWRQHLGPMSLLIGFSTLRSLSMIGAVTFLPLLWVQRGHSLVEGASLITVLLVVGIIGNIGGGHFADRLGRRPLMFGACLAAALLLALFLLSSGVWLWLWLGLLGIALYATLPVGILIGQDIFPENRSLGSGIAMGLSNGLAAVLLATFSLIPALHSPHTALWVMVGMVALAALMGLLLPEHHPGTTTRKPISS